MKDTLRAAVNVREELADEIPARTYATHGVDRYPAKMIPHLARYAISRVSDEGSTVLDPFCGCGTVQVECRITGRNSVGFDVNPVAVFLARGKSAICATETLLHHCQNVIGDAEAMRETESDTPSWMDYWFTPATLLKLCNLRRALLNNRRKMGQNYYDVLRAALIVSVRKCSRADPRSPKPFISKRARKTRAGKHFDPFQQFRRVTGRFAEAGSELRELIDSRPATCTSKVADSRMLSARLEQMSVDAVVTSPPYLTAQDYFRSSKLELAILGKWTNESPNRLGQSIIGSGRGRVSQSETRFEHPSEITNLQLVDSRSAAVAVAYREDMSHVFRELRTVLKPQGKCVFIVGDCTMRGIQIPVHKWFVELGVHHGMKLTSHLVDTIRNRRVPPQRVGHNGLIVQEHILFFQNSESKPK